METVERKAPKTTHFWNKKAPKALESSTFGAFEQLVRMRSAVRIRPAAPSGRNNMDILSAKLRVPGGCDLLFFKFSSCGEWIFSSNSSNWADLNSSFPDVCGENEKNALFQREKQGKLPSKLYTKFRASVCWLSQSHQRGALFQFQIQKGRFAHHTFTCRSELGRSGLFFTGGNIYG